MRLPSAPTTRWTLPLSVAALSLAGAALALVGVAPLVTAYLTPFDFDMPPSEPSEAEVAMMFLGVAISTVVLLAVALTLGLRARKWVAAKTVGWCVLFGWLNAGMSIALGHLFYGELERAAGGGLFGLVLGLLFALPFGLLYGGVAAFATHRLAGLRERPTLRSRLDAQRIVSIVVIGSSTFALLVSVAGWSDRVPEAIPAVVLGVGVVGLAQSLVRGYLLGRIAKDPAARGYERVALADLGIDGEGLWPLHPGVPDDAKHALVQRTESAGDGVYRGAAPRVPLALVE